MGATLAEEISLKQKQQLPDPNKRIDRNPFGNDLVEKRIHEGANKICETTKIGTDRQIIEKDVLNTDHIVEKIYDDFKDLSVKRVDGVEMKYWNPESEINSDPSRQILSGILKVSNGNGSCLAWSQLFHETLDAVGISGSQIFTMEVDPTSIVTSLTGTYSFLVKNWSFDDHILAGSNGILDSSVDPDDYTINGGTLICPYNDGILNSTRSGDDILAKGLLTHDLIYTPFQYYQYLDCGPMNNGVEGQMNPNPPAGFYGHWIVKYNNQIYDPSYGGGPHTGSRGGSDFGEEAHENVSIDGVNLETTIPGGGTVNAVLRDNPLNDENYLIYIRQLSLE